MIFAVVMFTQIVNLGMAVVTGGYAIVGSGTVNLFVFSESIMSAGFGKSGLKESAATATTEIV